MKKLFLVVLAILAVFAVTYAQLGAPQHNPWDDTTEPPKEATHCHTGVAVCRNDPITGCAVGGSDVCEDNI